jgi:chromate transporter
MNELLNLFAAFFKAGAVSFGGGYAIVPLLGDYLEKSGWMGAAEFSKIVTLSQMTPGPLAVNAATYVGAKVMGGGLKSVAGAAAATAGVTLPSFIFVILAAKLFDKIEKTEIYEFGMRGLRPAIIGFLLSAVAFFGKAAFLNGAGGPDPLGIGIGVLGFLLSLKFRLGTIQIILVSAIIGILAF